jgi:hypothetical protein
MGFSSKRVVAPLSGNSMQAGEYATVDNDPTASTGSKNDSKYNAGAGRRSNEGFRKGKAVGVICHQNPAAGQSFQILKNRLIVQAHRI